MPKNPHANFRPTLESYSGQGAFRFWCQMALPLTYDDSLSYYELLNKVVTYLNNTIEDVGKVEDNVAALNEAYGKLEDYVNTYFDEIDIEAELKNVLDAMAEDGSLDSLLDPLVAARLGDVVAEQINAVVANQIGGAVSEQIGGAVLDNLPAVVPDAVSDWLDENVTPTTPVVDSTLTISGAAADAKVTGNEITDLKSAIKAINDNIYDGEYALTVTIGAGVNPSTGGNANNQPKYARISSVEVPSRGSLTWICEDDDYEIMPWCYSSTGVSSATYSPTNGNFVTNEINIEFSSNDRMTRIAIHRKDDANMTEDDETKLNNSIHAFYNYYPKKVNRYAEQNQIGLTGGVSHPILRAGSLNFNGPGSTLQETFHANNGSTYIDCPLRLNKGDIISTGSYSLGISIVEKNENGYTRKRSYDWFTGEFVAPENGLYIFTVMKENTTVMPNEAESEIIIRFRQRTGYALPKNPYHHLSKVKNGENDYVFDPTLKDILTTCHLHTIRALYFTRAVNQGYEHLAISNYHPSKPTIPIAEILPTLEGYDASRDIIPSGFLESPNAEHIYFTDASDYVGENASTHLHLCSVGSYASSGAGNTGVGEGGFEGTVMEFAEEFENMRKYPKGGGITINHPVWSGIDANGIMKLLSVPNVFAMEIYNANSEHVNGKGYALTLWDEVLSNGVQIFGTAVPDHETEGAFWNDHLPLGFIHCLCVAKDEEEIMKAYRNGQFYTTIANDTLRLNYFDIDDNGLVTFKATDTGEIKIITNRVENTTTGNSATYQTNANDVFVRAEITTTNNRLFTNAIIL